MTGINTPLLRLEQSWEQTPLLGGKLTFELINLSNRTFTDFAFAYSSLSRLTDESVCENVVLARKFGHFHEYLPPEGIVLEPQGVWRFSVDGIGRRARHLTDGAQNPYLIFEDGTTEPIVAGDLLQRGRASMTPDPRLPNGYLEAPLHLTPWPEVCAIAETRCCPAALFADDSADDEAKAAIHSVAALHDRLFPEFPSPLALTKVDGGLPIDFLKDGSLSGEAYKIEFDADRVCVRFGGAAGRHYALISLAQLVYGTRADFKRFRFPLTGTIEDRPRHGWRGCHLDVSRQYFPLADVANLIDILAWHKFNVFHWHLTDDEGWRLEIGAYPSLTEVGAWRGPHEKMPALLGSGGVRYGGYYSKDDVGQIIAHAASLQVDVLPEIDIPGHCTAALLSVPEMTDGQEAPDCYRSVQGFPNNALNPAVPETYDFLEAVFGEVADLFPHPYVHVGGDEVAAQSWMASPLARKLKQEQGLESTNELQSYFLRKIQAMLAGMGKKMAGWDEVSYGGGVEPEGTLLMAWQSPEVGKKLAQVGYDVVMTPGQAYYLDMVQSDEWPEPGASWAGTSSVEHTYGFDAAKEFDTELGERLKGIQACIWTEHLARRGMFRRLVFPRLSAIGESAWTSAKQKNWHRFSALAPYTPTM